MIRRRLETKIKEVLTKSSSVALMGPRQIGKTTIALDVVDSTQALYLDLESRLDLEKVRDIRAFYEANQGQLIVLDEVQRIPELFTELRGIIDQERRRGSRSGLFLFLGSASIDLLQQSSESLAGRISYLELFPIDVLEYAAENFQETSTLWLRGGFPESLLAASDRDSLQWRQDFIRTYLERDIPMLGPRIPATTLERFWTMLAHNQGSVLNAAHLARNLDVSGVTISRYLDLMVDLLLVRRLQPWASNAGKRLVRSPKIYVRDSGITHALMGIESFNSLLAHPVVGGSWEGFVIENIMSVAPARMQPYFYRSAGGAEADLILEFADGKKWVIEIKRNSAPSLSKGFYIACEDIQPDKKFVIYSGKDTFPMGDGVIATSLNAVMQEVMAI